MRTPFMHLPFAPTLRMPRYVQGGEDANCVCGNGGRGGDANGEGLSQQTMASPETQIHSPGADTSVAASYCRVHPGVNSNSDRTSTTRHQSWRRVANSNRTASTRRQQIPTIGADTPCKEAAR